MVADIMLATVSQYAFVQYGEREIMSYHLAKCRTALWQQWIFIIFSFTKVLIFQVFNILDETKTTLLFIE